MTGQEFLMRMKMEHVTGSDIAEQCEISPQAVYKWFVDKDDSVKIPAKHWAKVANLLRISIDSLIPGTTNITAEGGSVAQQSGRDSSVTQGYKTTVSPIKSQLISLIEEVATEEYCRREIERLQSAARILVRDR